jgi:diguanylate cyclase (GGDEF)-like protein
MWEIPPMDLAAGQDGPVLAKVMSQIKAPESFLARVHQLYASPSETSHDEFETTDGKFIDRYTRGLSSDSGKNLGRVWFFRDITKRKQAEQLVRKMARHDGLTGLANRLVFVEALRDAIAEANRGRKSFAVIYLDLDRFKDVNDTLGHPIGDALLRSVANRLKANARETDTVARFGGDEFAVVVMDISEPADAAILAEKLLKAMSDPFSIRGNILQIGASIGIDLYGPDAPDAETLLSHADIALYRAKSEGRGVYRFFTDAMDAEVRTQVTLGAELREGVASEQFFLLYQPQVCSDSGRITGVEALIRWSHPLHGVLRPDLFMQTAEKIGLVGKLGHWALWAACRQGKAWLDAKIAPVRISVNVSALQFKAPLALEADIISALAETRLPPHLLELELTESALMVASRENSDVLVRLRRSGVTIAIDDFGTGYSSLDYLRQFPVDRIKIAQNFVTRLETMPGNAKIVKATIGLARELGIMVVAEGVETQEQLELLESWGCSEVQGFYFSKPLPPEDLAPFLRTGRMPFSKAARKVAG